ncbi:MAG TPA: hypothetical protein PLJ21_02935 [Pseudobdellovibrionaceae bacterium]|nr:hypothetical protein [Pseudobdellovibrionaceae bacterium]
MKNYFIIIFCFITLLITKNSLAQTPAKVEKENIIDSIDYPELQVVPRASERLLEEARFERDYGFFTHWTYWVSGAMTLYAGTSLGGTHKDPAASAVEKDSAANATKFSQVVGGGSLLLAAYMSYSKPYVSQLEKVQKIKPGNRRSDLLRERYAEEGLENPAKLISTLNWIVFFSNFISAGIVSSYANANTNVFALSAVLTSTLPFLFKHSYITVYEKHLEYKRKIYTPIVFFDNQNATPLLGFNYTF